MTFRFLHLADLHLETHFGGRPEAKERLRGATLEAFRRAVDRALEKRVHAVLVAGDLFDDPLLSLRTELEIVRAVQRLAEGGTHFLYACGNHDPGAPTRRAAQLGLLAQDGAAWRRRVHVFSRTVPEPVVVRDAEEREVGVVVGAGHLSAQEERNLCAGFHRLETHLPVVGLLHTQVESARGAGEHKRYAPSTRADFERLAYAYFALGHVHLRQQAFDGLPAWYPGNLQGRNAKETGPKGGLFVEAAPGGVGEPRFEAFAPVRWERLEVDGLAGVRSASELASHLAQRIEALRAPLDEELVAVVELCGPTPLAPLLRDPARLAELETALLDETGIVDVELRARRVSSLRDLDRLRANPSFLSRALALLERAHADPELLERLAPEHLPGFEAELDVEADLEARRAYLCELLEGLEEDLIDACLEEDA